MADSERTRYPVPVTPARVPAPQSPPPRAWPARPAPSIAPFVDQGWGARRRARSLARNLDLGKIAADAARQYFVAVEGAETAQQSAELVHERRRSVPIVAAAERAGLLTTFTQVATELDAAQHDRETRAADHQNRMYVDALSWQKAALALQADVIQATVTVDAIRGAGQADQARRERQQQLEQEQHRIELLRLDLMSFDLMAQLRERLTAMRQSQKTGPADPNGLPDMLSKYLKAEFEVARNKGPAIEIARAIRNRAAAEGRPLTEAEQALVDIYESAAAAAESDIRRGEAADF